MIKKILIIICAFQLFGFIQSCCQEEISCFWKDFSLENIDNSDLIPVISNQVRINKKAYGIRVKMIDSILWNSYATLNFAQNATATSCGKKYTVKKRINTIQIMLLIRNTKEEIDLTKYFKARKSIETNSKYSTLTEIINEFNTSDIFGDSDFDLKKSLFDLYLMDPINIQDTCFFKVNLQFNDSSILSHETSPVLLY